MTTIAPQQRLAVLPGSTATAPNLPGQLNVQIPLQPAFNPYLSAGRTPSDRRLLNVALQPPAQWTAFDANITAGSGVLTFSAQAMLDSSIGTSPAEVTLTMAGHEVVNTHAQNLSTGNTVAVRTRHGAPGQAPAWQATIQRQPTIPTQLMQGLNNAQQTLLAGALGTPQGQWWQTRYSTYGASDTLEYAFHVGSMPNGDARSVVSVQATLQNQQVQGVTVFDSATGESVSAPVLAQPLQLLGQPVAIASSAVANDPDLNAILTGGGPRNHVRRSQLPNGVALTFTTRSPNSGAGPDDREVTLHLMPSPGNSYQVVGGSVATLAAVPVTTVPPTTVPTTTIPTTRVNTSVPTTTVGTTTVPTTQPTTTASGSRPVRGGQPPGTVTGTYPGAGGAAVTLAQGVIDRMLSDSERTASYLANNLHAAWAAQNPNRTMDDLVRDIVATATTAPQGTPFQMGAPGKTPAPWRFDFTLCGQNVQALLMFDARMTQCDDVLVLTAGSDERKEAHRMRLQYHRRHP